MLSVQREGAVVHLIATRLTDLSAELAGIGAQEGVFPLLMGEGTSSIRAGQAGLRAAC